jgi:hypothetical protein
MDHLKVPVRSVVTATKREDRWVDVFVGASSDGVQTNWVVSHDPWNDWIRLMDPAFGDGFTVPDRAWVMPVRRGQFHTVETWSEWYPSSDSGLGDPHSGYGPGGAYGHGLAYGAGSSHWPSGHYKSFQETVDHTQVDIFVVGLDGGVYTNWVVDHGKWTRWLRLTDPDYENGFSVPPSAVVWPIKRDEYQEDIFVVGQDGVVYTNYVVGNDAWTGWQPIGRPIGAMRAVPGSVVSAIKRDDKQEDLFVVDRHGGIYTNWVIDHGRWQDNWLRLTDPGYDDGFTVEPGSVVWPIMRDEQQLEIFVVGRDRSVYTNWVLYDDDDDQWLSWNQWLRIPAPGNPSPPSKSVVTAVKRDEHQEDIFVVGEGGQVYTTYVLDRGRWEHEWIPIGGSDVRVPALSVVWPIKRDDDQLDVFAVGEDGGVYTTYVVGHDNWKYWQRVEPL